MMTDPRREAVAESTVADKMIDMLRSSAGGMGLRDPEMYQASISVADALRIADALAARDARIAALGAASQWRPIETAPKDGTWILAFDPEWGHQIVKWNFWFAPPDERGAFQTEGTYDRNIIAWMPLPAPPETKSHDRQVYLRRAGRERRADRGVGSGAARHDQAFGDVAMTRTPKRGTNTAQDPTTEAERAVAATIENIKRLARGIGAEFVPDPKKVRIFVERYPGAQERARVAVAGMRRRMPN
jgi:hypothetical protein